MRRQGQFDEVMIVNPTETNQDQRVRLMRFHNTYPPEFGGFAEPDPYGYYGEVDPTYGYYAQDPVVQGNAANGYGYYGYEPAGYTQPEPVGYYAEEYPVG